MIAACLFLVASPALADVTARYAGMEAGAGMIVRIADNGDTFIGHGSNTSYLTTGGVTYIILSDARGTFTVRRETVIAVLHELTRGGEPPPGPGRGAAVTETGAENVAGFAGRAFALGPRNIPSDRLEVVISDAPELAPVGRVVAAHLVPWFQTVGGAPPELMGALQEVLARGAVTRLGSLFRLEAIDRAPIPRAVFALPSPPLDRARLLRRLDISAPR